MRLSYQSWLISRALLSPFLISFAAAQGNIAGNNGGNNVPTNLPKLDTTATTGLDTPSLSTTVSTRGVATSPSSTDVAPTSPKDSASATSVPTLITASLPKLSSSTEIPSKSYDGIQNAPKLSGAFSYPDPSVPPTVMAPYMQISSLPEGTVFICAGSILGFVTALILAWRVLVAWSLRRSVHRAAYGSPKAYGGGYNTDVHASMPLNPGSTIYKARPGSAPSMDQLSGINRSAGKGPTLRGSGLFFSPTSTPGILPSANRGSTYFPAGYYAPGNSASRPISLGTLDPRSQGYQPARSIGPTPPESPSLPPSLPPSRGADMPFAMAHSGTAAGLSSQPSISTLNTIGGRQERAPSIALEDLFDSSPPVDRIP